LKEVILLKIGELVLKGLNRRDFEDKLLANIKRRLKPFGTFKLTKAQSAVYVEPQGSDIDIEDAIAALTRVFGIAMLSRAGECPKNIKEICKFASEYTRDCLNRVKTFKVESKRADKAFPLTSPQVSARVGDCLLETFPHLRVDVHNPEVVITVEIRDFSAYVHSARIPGAGGMPVGTGGKAMLMLSGGIDSPVAGYMTAKRGVELDAIHFYSYPYTSERAKEKVIALARLLCGYCERITLYNVPFTEIQSHIKKHCPDNLATLITRRIMMEIACKQAQKTKALAIITGESIGQVASQTIHALAVTDAVATMPVFRPVIGMDKNEIVQISRKIGTFETSILPYEDCCTVFTPKHPKTRPSVRETEDAQNLFDFSDLIEEAFDGIEVIKVNI
jgi:thiamine biosynthesis protein ThiI